MVGHVVTDAIEQLDLNLLRTLNVLLRTKSVTRAGRDLGRSQPAVSHALQRLRDALGDPLLVRAGRNMVLTPRAEALRPRVRTLLADIRRLLTEGTEFEPATAERQFILACPDALAPVVPKVLEALSEAPRVTLELRIGSDVSAVDDGADLVIGQLPEDAAGVMSRRLGTINERVALRAGHPALSRPWTAEEFVSWPHILVRTPGSGPSSLERALASVGLERRVGLTVPAFLLAPHVVARSELLFTAADVLLDQVAEPLSLVLRPPPIPITGPTAAAIWSERVHADPGHRWFRDHVIAALESLIDRPA